jgi:CRISPR-associated protein Cas5t
VLPQGGGPGVPGDRYGFLLALVGETDRRRHIGCRVASGLLAAPAVSVVLRTVWRVKKPPLGAPGNARPDYQQLLTGGTKAAPFVELLLWLDSAGEPGGRLEDRVRAALAPPVGAAVTRFGGLSLGESSHLVDEVSPWDKVKDLYAGKSVRTFRVAPGGRFTFPVWVDHVGSAGTRYATGDLVDRPAAAAEPAAAELPVIRPDP